MSQTEFLKQKIISEQEKLNELLKNGKDDILASNRTAKLSRKLDKLIVEYHRLMNKHITY